MGALAEKGLQDPDAWAPLTAVSSPGSLFPRGARVLTQVKESLAPLLAIASQGIEKH